MNLTHDWKQIVEPAEPFLEQVILRLGEQVTAFDPEIVPYARYALTNQGKQLRPALVALAAETSGRCNDNHVTVAVIIEMIHLATLVHDDVMDEASIRRSRPTVAAKWGNEISVLLGDCLFAHALKLASGFHTTEVCRAVSAATNTVCSGEILQTNRRGRFEVNRAAYFKIISMKTAELFALSCELGARMSGVSDASCAAMRQYGMSLGTAYQIYDDCVDLYGSEATVGKSLGTDLASGKLTLPVLIYLEKSTPTEQAHLKKLLANWNPDYHAEVLELLDQYHALDESCHVIQGYLQTARDSLQSFAASQSRNGLLALTGFLAAQTEALRPGLRTT
ncbi:MAG TPA: polyprenyl synthetase family protein [Roseimicrobium sp.]|nr:polyprenyl synthetase family protein [Roseimicrobium sp.]